MTGRVIYEPPPPKRTHRCLPPGEVDPWDAHHRPGTAWQCDICQRVLVADYSGNFISEFMNAWWWRPERWGERRRRLRLERLARKEVRDGN